jgi:hypothetical protein
MSFSFLTVVHFLSYEIESGNTKNQIKSNHIGFPEPVVYIFSGISHRIHYIFRHISQNTLYFQTYLTEYIGYDSKKMPTVHE